MVKREIRPIYFGLENIILQEIESQDKEIDVHKFFIEEETAGFPSQADLMARSRSLYAPTAGPIVSGAKMQAEGLSDVTSEVASTSQAAS